MNINATLIGQTLVFIIFVWFCMKFVWPPIVEALAQRKKTIADGLAAGEKGKHELELAQKRSTDVIREAKQKAAEIIALAEKRSSEIADEAKEHAKQEAGRILAAAQGDIEQELNRAREQLRAALAGLVVDGASRILEKEIDAKSHAKLIDGLVKQL